MRVPNLNRSLAAVAAAVLLVACGSNNNADDDGTIPTTVPATSSVLPTTDDETSSESVGDATLMLTEGALGEYLVGSNGMTLYMFEKDTDGKSACYDQCATAWPPLTVTGDPVAGDGVDASLLSTVARDDGSMQVVYGEYPLYYFFKDEAPGDTNGQGSTGAGAPWWVVGADGVPIETMAEATTTSG